MTSGPPPFLFSAIGNGNNTVGYWLGDISSNKLIVAPKSTETSLLSFGSVGTFTYTTSVTDGLSNTNTLASFGTVAYPAAGYCKYLSTGGYNTWYLPAKDELKSLYSNKSATPFATANSFTAAAYWSSTENNDYNVWQVAVNTGGAYGNATKNSTRPLRAVRRSTI
jgi:hypothetical protein